MTQQRARYARDRLLLGLDGRLHTVQETVWCAVDGQEVETVITTTGEKHPVEGLTPLEGMHTGDLVGVTVAPGWRICLLGHERLIDAGVGLDYVRATHRPDRTKAAQEAESAALWAAARFSHATGELTVDLWRVVVREAAEAIAGWLTADRGQTSYPEPAPEGFFGSGHQSLKECSPEGYRALVNGARCWQEDGPGRAERAVLEAAVYFSVVLGAGDAAQWVTAARYLTGTYVHVLP